MTKLTPKIKEAISQTKLFPMATACANGIPNVVPLKYMMIADDNTLWLVDNFMEKTLNNLQQNPIAAINIMLPEQTFAIQIKGKIAIESAGAQYQTMRNHVLKIQPEAPAKSLVIMTITEIYDCWPGDGLGRRLDLLQ